MVANGKDSIFETDLFYPVIEYLEESGGKKYLTDSVWDRYFEIVADHIR